MTGLRDHWEGVYTARPEDGLSWYEDSPGESLALIRSACPEPP